MVNVAVYLGAKEFRATVQLRDALKFEMKLANVIYNFYYFLKGLGYELFLISDFFI